jgi:hypothetical protein
MELQTVTSQHKQLPLLLKITAEIRLKQNHTDSNQSKHPQTTINNPTSTHSEPKQQKPADTK